MKKEFNFLRVDVSCENAKKVFSIETKRAFTPLMCLAYCKLLRRVIKDNYKVVVRGAEGHSGVAYEKYDDPIIFLLAADRIVLTKTVTKYRPTQVEHKINEVFPFRAPMYDVDISKPFGYVFDFFNIDLSKSYKRMSFTSFSREKFISYLKSKGVDIDVAASGFMFMRNAKIETQENGVVIYGSYKTIEDKPYEVQEEL